MEINTFKAIFSKNNIFKNCYEMFHSRRFYNVTLVVVNIKAVYKDDINYCENFYIIK